MTKNEIIEAINATIATNGQKAITAESLANLLIEMVNATPEGGSSSGGSNVIFYLGNVDMETGMFTQIEEQKAHNAEMFNVVANADAIPPIVIDMSEIYGADLGGLDLKASMCPIMALYVDEEAAAALGESSALISMSTLAGEYAVFPDGRVELFSESEGE